MKADADETTPAHPTDPDETTSAHPAELSTVRLAHIALMRMAEPGDRVMGRLIARYGPEDVVTQIRRSHLSPAFVGEERPSPEWKGRDLDRLVEAWKLRWAPPERDFETGVADGGRLIIPGDPEWPTQLNDLGDHRPYGMWLHGSANLRLACVRSVSIVGSRAASPYGVSAASEFAAQLGDERFCVVSGGAYGIDAAAHRGALSGAAATVAVLACGIDVCYPTAHVDLFRAVRSNGLVISECPPGVHPTRPRFLVRNRVIAALSRGTVVIQAAIRSGALSTAGHAFELNRHLMALPGPITSDMSAGCHQLIRQQKAVCVTSVRDVLELIGGLGDPLMPEPRGPVHARDHLNDETRRVLEAVPARAGRGPAAIAIGAGVDLGTALSCLGSLALAGFVERVAQGWRLRPSARDE
ncbi:DNA-processing protein DprA [Streptosporangiaceae bacterium NEAU-GS5]|nr:DNA-processing protein DprA [Streptosporangiaceae bacterium NEAU-GS5]